MENTQIKPKGLTHSILYALAALVMTMLAFNPVSLFLFVMFLGLSAGNWKVYWMNRDQATQEGGN